MQDLSDGGITRRPRHYGRWRAACLASVYVLMGIHIAHWRLAGQTLAPLELNEVMHTLELGIVTAGFLFMAAAFVSAAIFGRFFCSWGCHILALEDLCAWMLGKIRVRPKPVRSRVLLLVPPGAMFYMFIWPQISRLLQGQPFPEIRVLSDTEGWASFVTTDFWRNLPGPGITLLTLAICGFAIVYILGSRSFCTYACPYGVIFGLADRLAPGRIITTGKCRQAGHCTAVCPSHVRVHEEIATFGKVVDSACLKCLTCVATCPHGALGYGFTRPSLLRSFSRTGRRRLPYDFTLGEDALMAFTFIATLLIFRGLYDLVPFLLTLGLGGLLAYLAVVSLRLARRSDVRLNNFQLKRHGRLTNWGAGFAALAMVLGAFVGHSAFIRYHEFLGQRALERISAGRPQPPAGPAPALLAEALGHYRTIERSGLFRSPLLDRRLASLYLWADSPAAAEPYLVRTLSRDPDDHESRLRLAGVLTRRGRIDEARRHLGMVAAAGGSSANERRPPVHARAAAHEMLGGISAARGETARAIGEYRAALLEQPKHASAHLALSELLAGGGQLTEAAAHLQQAVSLAPESAWSHYNLAVVLAQLGQEEEAIELYRRAIRLDPRDPEAHNNLGFLLARRDDFSAAVECFRRAIELRPQYALGHLNLARAYQQLGRLEEAGDLFRRAAELDPRYAPLAPPAQGERGPEP